VTIAGARSDALITGVELGLGGARLIPRNRRTACEENDRQ